jgi:hypothetical protein
VDALSFLGSRTGAVISTSTGDLGDPLSLSAAGRDSVRAVTSHQVVVTYDADGTAATDNTAAGPCDFLTATTAIDLIAGNEDGDVYAFNDRASERHQGRRTPPDGLTETVAIAHLPAMRDRHYPPRRARHVGEQGRR